MSEVGDSNVQTLRRVRIGWPTLTALGVAYVIAGAFVAWNYALAQGGWAGLMIAVVIVAVMYAIMCDCLAELAAMMPSAGGGYSFVRAAFGPAFGFLVGCAILLEYVGITAAIATFTVVYVDALTGLSAWPVMIGMYAIFVAIHVIGVGEALRFTVGLTLAAALGLALALCTLVTHVDVSRLFDIAPLDATTASSFLPFGAVGIWAALPFSVALFLGVEGVPLAAEEVQDPARTIPRGILGAVGVLFLLAVALIVIVPGAVGSRILSDAPDPLMVPINAGLQGRYVGTIVNVAAIIGLLASFFSAIYAYSRITFALARAGYLPAVLARVNRRGSPYVAVIVPGALSLLLASLGTGDKLAIIMVFAATLSYIWMLAAHLRLRIARPEIARPYRSRGGLFAPVAALCLSLATFTACFIVDVTWSLAGAALLGVLMIYYAWSVRGRLAVSPST